MKTKLFNVLTAVILLLIPNLNFGQAPTLGRAGDYALFTIVGAVTNSSTPVYLTHITGNVGTKSDPTIPGFGNIDGQMHFLADAENTAGANDLLSAYGQLKSRVPTFFPSTTLGNGQTLLAGVDSIFGATVLNLDLNLDAQNVPGAVFIIKISGPLSTNAGSKVKLVNGALACNVFWQIEGLVDMATNTSFKGTIIALNAAINMTVGDTLEGRALSTNGAITVNSVLVYTPIGCGSPTLTGPAAPDLASALCYAIFASNGALNGTNSTTTIGDVGNNGGGSITGWPAGNVTGTLHLTPDPSTIQCATDLSNAYNTLNALAYDIELLHPDLFGHDLVLTPHTYLMNGAAQFTDSLYLNGQGNPNAVFVIKIMGGALTTSTYSKVKLINGTQSKNVFWMIQGQVDINNYSVFRGNIVVSVGAINLVNTGVVLDGRALTMNGAITTTGLNVVIPPGCSANPIIITQPVNQLVCAGSPASFSVTASGTGLTYQWRKGNIILSNGSNISGATSSVLSISPANISDTSSFYNVIVSGSALPNDTSNYVSLMVNIAPVITTQPSNQTVCAGSSASFSVVATGTALTYQWRKGAVNLVNGLNISGANLATLNIIAVGNTDTAYNYNVVITGACTPNDTSINVSLKLTTRPIISTEPTNQTACAGASVSFTVAAIGTGLTYQWKKGSVIIAGANLATLTINPVSITDTAYNYNVVVTGICALKDTSLNVFLVVNTAPVITTQPANQTACAGSSASFSVVATGTALTYQWRKGNSIIAGANLSTLTINPVSVSAAAANYNVVISGACASNDTSINVSLTVNTAPVITIQPANQTACAGSSASFSVVATGTALAYQWRKGTSIITGANLSTLTINPVSISDAAANYNVVISGSCASNDTSINVSLVVNTAPVITTQPANQTVCAGSSASFSVVATGTALVYQWRKGTSIITGANLSTLTINLVSVSDAAANYNVVVSGTCSPNDTSINVSLVVNTAPNITTAPSSQTACAGSSISFSAIATGTALTYQWRKGVSNLTNGGNISGATSAMLTINPANSSDAASNYNVVVTGTCGSGSTSPNASLLVNPIPVAVASSNSPICAGSAVSTLNLIAQTVVGGTYSWTGPNGYSSNVQNPVILNATIADAGIYSLTITVNGCVSGTSSITVVVNNCTADLSVVKTADNMHPFIGRSIVFTIIATNNGPDIATAVSINDILQTGYTYISSTTTTGTFDAVNGVWTIGNMNNGASAILTIAATVNSTGNYINTAIIYGNEVDPDMANNVSSIEPIPTDFFIPEGFSPNGDGINDVFVIRGILNYPNNTFVIFNRWGNKVFETTHYQNTWNGTSTMGLRVGGDELPVGTFFYVLDLGDGTPIYKGTIYLNK